MYSSSIIFESGFAVSLIVKFLSLPIYNIRREVLYFIKTKPVLRQLKIGQKGLVYYCNDIW